MMAMIDIRKQYGVPAKRGMRVRWQDEIGRIVGSFNRYLNIKLAGYDQFSKTVHPLDVDYDMNGEWVSGARLKEIYDAKIEAFNNRAERICLRHIR